MASLLIRVTHSENSQEYKFNKLGPIYIGSNSECDLYLNDSAVPAKLLEVRLSAGKIFVKEIGARSQVYLNNIVMPHLENCHYREGERLSYKEGNYTIQIYALQEDELSPPPFFENEFHERLQVMNLRIQEKENEIRTLSEQQNRKKEQLEIIEVKHDRHAVEKSRLEVEISALRTQKENLTLELRQSIQKSQDEQERFKNFSDHIKTLENEENVLRETIVSQNFILSDLKQQQNVKNKEISEQQSILADLEQQTRRKDQDLKKINHDYELQNKEIKIEEGKVQHILHQSQTGLKEIAKIDKEISQSLKTKAMLEHELFHLQTEMKNTEDQRAKALNRLSELKVQIEKEERNLVKNQETLLMQTEEERNLKDINAQMRAELTKIEDKLSAKKTQLGQVEFQNQDALRKLNTINFDIQRTHTRLDELLGEEKAFHEKMKTLKNDQDYLIKEIELEKESIHLNFGNEKAELDKNISALKEEQINRERSLFSTESQLSLVSGKLSEVQAKLHLMGKEKITLESQLVELRAGREEVEGSIKQLKAETLKLEHDKSRVLRELNILESKLQDCEININEKKREAEREIESFKRDERSKIEAERQVQIAEVETLRQKTLMEVESSYRKKLDDVHEMKMKARKEAAEIIEAAHRAEIELTQEAQKRLQIATEEAVERESAAHSRILEAQNYLKDKEVEAETILNKSRIESRQLLQKTEAEILDDLSKRKQKIKKFLSMKQEVGQAHIQSLLEKQQIRIKRNEEKSAQRLEEIKKRELKRIAKIRDEELTRQSEMKELALKEFRAEKEKTLRMIQELKTKQEAELAEKKKTMLEHINSTKFSQKQSWEEEVRREKESFNKTKKDRINNATMAVMNVLVAEIGPQGEGESALREKIKANLEMAIDGQNAQALKDVEQVLDFNPLKRKKFLPVIKKYALEAGIPAALAIIFLADIGGARTSVVDFSKDLMKQQQSASEIYVNQQKTEWKEKHSFNPEMSVGYKDNYTDNVIYTVDFEKVMDNEEFQNDWILKVHDFMVKDLELSEDVAINYISAEGSLIKELAVMRKDLHPQFLDQGLKKMRDLETAQLGWLNEKMATPEKMEKFVTFRKGYFDTFYKDKFKADRGVASEAPSQTQAEVVPVP